MNELQKRIFRTYCTKVRNEQGKELLVCVGPTEDLEKMRVLVDDGEKIKSFDKVDKALEFLKNRDVSFEERERVAEFILEKLRAVEIMYDRFGFNSKINPLSLDFGLEKERFRK